ncbi:ABC transporter permease [Shouchella miscanthi]|uniref:ABC transporter permease n=1 Tax=Shouchella miscanthi TaxID=2598861 RepID=A0ABU6NFT0_9BACI|nr:ABC transporter permease [Shouchella miscanthi]
MSIFQKELKQLVHDKGALLSTLLLPFVSTMILGFALTNSFSSEVSFEDVSIAVIETSTLEEDLQIASERFSVHEDELKPLAVPDSLFAYMDGDISVDYYSPDSNVVHEDYTAVIEIPSAYRLMLWHEQLVGGWSEQVESFQLYVNQEQRQHAMMVETMMNSYMEQVYAHTELAENDEGIIDFGNVVVQGTSPLTSFEYYTYGMGVLYVFFTAGLMANFAFSEKKGKIYGRLVIANVQPANYLLAKFATSCVIVFLQLLVLFGLSMLIFQITITNWLSFMAVAIVLCLAVGSVASLLVAIQFRANTEKVANVFMLLVVSILGFLGGSFFPSSNLSPLLNEIGQFTPNGRALQAFIQAGQGESIAQLSNSLLYLSIFSLVLFVVAWVVFPSKGGIES